MGLIRVFGKVIKRDLKPSTFEIPITLVVNEFCRWNNGVPDKVPTFSFLQGDGIIRLHLRKSIYIVLRDPNIEQDGDCS